MIFKFQCAADSLVAKSATGKGGNGVVGVIQPSSPIMRSRAMSINLWWRRSIRMFSPDPVPRDLIESAVAAASTAPSGAHKQPWTFVAVSDPATKERIRLAAETEEKANYLENRMNAEWQEALAPLGTDHHKEFLEVAPWLVVLFEQRYECRPDGSNRKNYYVKESTGIAAGLFVAAIHEIGLATLPHTPSPMAFLRTVLGRPDNERPFVTFPVGLRLRSSLGLLLYWYILRVCEGCILGPPPHKFVQNQFSCPKFSMLMP